MVLTEAEIEAELNRIMEALEVDEEKVKDLEKRMMEVVEKNKGGIDPKYTKTIEYLKMDKRLKSMIKTRGSTSIVKKKNSSSSSH
ncbi:PREDICTED: uncharacterized protein LOC109130977 [Camelina sativa]|uniref:Uncharacterized protein LOC109130977 n=1 Tax=Camelina sativa TaxID=90675 RepID=A0ABM1RCN3_CAMSA|nr:PREDICTED: uncharacterized protein LOC109130977 [Camelina sativa]